MRTEKYLIRIFNPTKERLHIAQGNRFSCKNPQLNSSQCKEKFVNMDAWIALLN